MRKIVALVVAVLLGTPTEMLAQGLAETTRLHGPLLTAAVAEATRLEGSAILVGARPAQTVTPAASSSPPRRSWPARHPVVLGTLIGAGVGLAVDAGTCGWAGGGCGIWLYGMGAGAFTGLLVSAWPKPTFTAAPPPSQPDVPTAVLPSSLPDILRVERVVRALGVSQQIVVTDVNGRKLSGSIQSIEQDHFVVVPDRQPTPVEVPFAEVRDVRKKPLGTVAKIGIAAGVVGVALTIALIASCNSPDGICQ